ncbi:MAG TPA: hypothetical protein VF719_01010, partial [Abditibacteriaceae bacterium]
GFLAVFAAGVALRRVERKDEGSQSLEESKEDESQKGDGTEGDESRNPAGHKTEEELATHPEHGPAFMAKAVLAFNEQLERIGEVTVVLLVGAMLTRDYIPREALWFVPLLFLVVRPIAVLLGTIGSGVNKTARGYMAWFGIRGVGSLYYLMYAIQHGLPDETAKTLTALTLTTMAASIVVHGISVTPFMSLYTRKTED